MYPTPFRLRVGFEPARVNVANVPGAFPVSTLTHQYVRGLGGEFFADFLFINHVDASKLQNHSFQDEKGQKKSVHGSS